MNFNQDTIQLEDQISHSNQESLADDNYKDINNNKGYPQRQNIYSIRSNQTSSTKECTSYQNKISQREGSQTSSDQRIKDQKKTEEEQLHNLLKKCYEEWQEEEQQIQQKILLNQESNDKNLIEQGSQAHTFLQILVQLPEMKNILKNEGKIMNLTKKKQQYKIILLITKILKIKQSVSKNNIKKSKKYVKCVIQNQLLKIILELLNTQKNGVSQDLKQRLLFQNNIQEQIQQLTMIKNKKFYSLTGNIQKKPLKIF
ncbi:hypothetical protein ABPG72_013750 [Tetrahymena utriculariae]